MTSTPTKYYADAAGRYLGGYAGLLRDDGTEVLPDVPQGAVEVTEPPEDGRQVWDGTAWGAKPLPESKGPAAVARIQEDETLRRLVAVMAKRLGVTPATLIAEIRNET